MQVLHQALQQVEPMPAHALDGGWLEQIRSVGQGGVQALRAVAGVQTQIELCGALRPAKRLDRQARQGIGQCRAGFVAMVEHGLEQRAVAQVALRLQGIDQLLERRSEEHTSELQSLMRISYAVFCLKKKNETK